MPEFPRYSSKGQINSQQPSFLAPEDRTGEVIAEAGANVGKTVQEIGVKWNESVSRMQKATYESNREIAVAQAVSKYQDDPNFSTPDALNKAYREIDEAIKVKGDGFSDKGVEALAMIESKKDAEIAKIQLKNLWKKNQIANTQTAVMRRLDLAASKGDAEKISLVMREYGDSIFGDKNAYELERKYIKQAKYNSFLSDLNSNPSETQNKISKNDYQFDIAELEKAKNIYASESKKIQAINENDMLGAYLNGSPPSEIEIKQAMKEGKVDAKFAESMIHKINDPKPDKLSQDVAYIDFQKRDADLLSKGDKATTEEILTLMSDAMQAHSKGLLDKSDVQRILWNKDRNEVMKQRFEELAQGVLSKTQPKNWLEHLSFWSDEYAEKKPEIKARMYRKLIDGISQGQDGYVLMKNIIDDEIDIQMAENIKKPDRQYAVNPDTRQRAYSDDGGATWYDEKTGKEIK
jgi:hypothetical protein